MSQLDVKSVFNKHLIKSSIDDEQVEMWCGRTGPASGRTTQPRPGPLCDSCQAAARFTADLDEGRGR